MRSLLIQLSVLILLPCFASAQEWAGPDTATCGALGVIIGSDDPCEECCYLWSPATGLDCTDCKNPKASPTTEQDYTVTVVDKTLRVIGTDQVHVGIEFGEIAITPDFLLYGIDESEVSAHVTKLGDVNEPNEIEWDFSSPTLGCMIVPQGLGAKVTPGNLYGEIILEARKVAVQGCYVRKTIPVNNGVKEVMATDPDNSNRVAETGETLYVIGQEDVIIHALPNQGGFKDGVPDWKPDSHGSTTPMDGEDYFTISEGVGTAEYIAGDPPDFQPQVTVVRMPLQIADETTITLPLLQSISNALDNAFKSFKETPTAANPCGTFLPFTFNLTTPTIKYNTQKVEIYDSPRTSEKVEFAAEVGFESSGKLFHPAFTKTFKPKFINVTICSRLYLEITAGAAVNVKIAKDPSMPDSSYQITNPEFVISFGIGGAAEFAFNPPGYLLTANAKISSSAKCTFTLENKTLVARAKLNPLTTKISAKIQSLSNMGEYEDLSWGVGNFSKELEIYPAKDVGTFNLYNFEN